LLAQAEAAMDELLTGAGMGWSRPAAYGATIGSFASPRKNSGSRSSGASA